MIYKTEHIQGFTWIAEKVYLQILHSIRTIDLQVVH